MNLGDMVIARTGDGEHEGRIVGRTLESNAKYDVRTNAGIVNNVPANHVQLATPTAKPTPPAAPKVNVSQPRENGLCASPGHRASTPADTSMPQLS
jgi:transcription initiation factor TFIID subunit TAF12